MIELDNNLKFSQFHNFLTCLISLISIDFTILNKTVLLCAKRNSGKSRLLRYLVLCEKDKFDKLFIICPTECVNSFYKDLTSKDCIFDEYNDDWVMKLINKMTEIKTQKKIKMF